MKYDKNPSNFIIRYLNDKRSTINVRYIYKNSQITQQQMFELTFGTAERTMCINWTMYINYMQNVSGVTRSLIKYGIS